MSEAWFFGGGLTNKNNVRWAKNYLRLIYHLCACSSACEAEPRSHEHHFHPKYILKAAWSRVGSVQKQKITTILLTSCTIKARLSKISITSSIASKPTSSAISSDMSSSGREEDRVECSAGISGLTFGFLVVSSITGNVNYEVCTHMRSLDIIKSNGLAFLCARYTSRMESHGSSSWVTSSGAVSSEIFTPLVTVRIVITHIMGFLLTFLMALVPSTRNCEHPIIDSKERPTLPIHLRCVFHWQNFPRQRMSTTLSAV